MKLTYIFTLFGTAIAISFAAAPPVAAVPVVASEVHLSADYYGDFGLHESVTFDRTWTGAADSFGSARVETRLDQTRDPLGPAPGYASVAFGPSGLSNAHVSAITTGSNFQAAVLESSITQSAEMLIPSSPGTDYAVYYSFELFNMFVEVWDQYNNGSGSALIHGTIEYDVLLDGIFKYTLAGSVLGYRDSTYLQVNCVTCTEDYLSELTGPGDVPRRIDFAPISHLYSTGTDLLLGTVAPDIGNDTFTVETRMSARLVIPTFTLDAGGRVNISDPASLALRAGETVRLEQLSAVIPLPGSFVLLLLGLGLQAALRRFSKR